MTNNRRPSVDDIAAYLVGIKRDIVYRWISERNMPGRKIGRLCEFQKEEIDKWVKAGEAGKEGLGDRR